MKPIEEGCLAVTYGCSIPKNNGKSITVGKFIGQRIVIREGIIILTQADDWEVNRLICKINADTGKPLPPSYSCSERRLLRIDGGDFEEEAEQEEVLIIAKAKG